MTPFLSDLDSSQRFPASFSPRLLTMLQELNSYLKPFEFGFAAETAVYLLRCMASESLIASTCAAACQLYDRQYNTALLSPSEEELSSQIARLVTDPASAPIPSIDCADAAAAVAIIRLRSLNERYLRGATIFDRADNSELTVFFDSACALADRVKTSTSSPLLEHSLKELMLALEYESPRLINDRPTFVIACKPAGQNDLQKLASIFRAAGCLIGLKTDFDLSFEELKSTLKLYVSDFVTEGRWLDNTVASAAAHYPHLEIRRMSAKDLPSEFSWIKQSCTIYCKGAIFRRIKLRNCRKLDPVPSLIKTMDEFGWNIPYV